MGGRVYLKTSRWSVGGAAREFLFRGLGHKQQWGEKNWRKGGKERGRCGREKSIKPRRDRSRRLGDSPDRGSGWTRCREQWAS